MTRESWTDDKLDGLTEKIDLRFDHVDERLGRLEAGAEIQRSEIKQGFAAINAKFERMDTRFDAMNARFEARFDALQRSLLYVLISSVTISIAVAGLAAVFVK